MRINYPISSIYYFIIHFYRLKGHKSAQSYHMVNSYYGINIYYSALGFPTANTYLGMTRHFLPRYQRKTRLQLCEGFIETDMSAVSLFLGEIISHKRSHVRSIDDTLMCLVVVWKTSKRHSLPKTHLSPMMCD